MKVSVRIKNDKKEIEIFGYAKKDAIDIIQSTLKTDFMEKTKKSSDNTIGFKDKEKE